MALREQLHGWVQAARGPELVSVTVLDNSEDCLDRMCYVLTKRCGHHKDLSYKELENAGQCVLVNTEYELASHLGQPTDLVGCTECVWERGIERGPCEWARGLAPGEWCWMNCMRCGTPVDSRDVVWLAVGPKYGPNARARAHCGTQVNVCPACALGHPPPPAGPLERRVRYIAQDYEGEPR